MSVIPGHPATAAANGIASDGIHGIGNPQPDRNRIERERERERERESLVMMPEGLPKGRTVLGIDAPGTEREPSGVAVIVYNGVVWRLSAVAPSYDAFIRRGADLAEMSRHRRSLPNAYSLLAAAAGALLRRSFEALPSGGAVVISELLVNDENPGPVPAALMSLNMLIETEGRNYTPAEYSAWLKEAGFRHIERVWFDAPAANGAVIGRKP